MMKNVCIRHQYLAGTMKQEGQESPLPGDIKQVSGCKEEYRGSHIDQGNLMGIVIPRRRVIDTTSAIAMNLI